MLSKKQIFILFSGNILFIFILFAINKVKKEDTGVFKNIVEMISNNSDNASKIDLKLLKEMYNKEEKETYIILGVFNCKEDYAYMQEKMQHYYKNIQVKIVNGRFLVYIGSFENKRIALNEIQQLKLLSINGVLVYEI